jgi:phospholipid/cholesterol/gamma-HCH transport system substrate-binding protein
METRSNQILVGTIVLALLAALAAFIIWLAGMNRGATKEYDIFFSQSVEGLSKGAPVTFAGVPSGQVKEIALWTPNPEFVRVRIAVDQTLPVLIGTTATVGSVSFTAPPQIQLAGAVKGAPPITEVGPAGVPTIPTRTTGLGALLNNAPQLLERLSVLTERLTEILSDDNQKSFGRTLTNIDKLTGNVDRFTSTLARNGPGIEGSITDARKAIREAGSAAKQFNALAGSTTALVNNEGRPMMADLRRTIQSAEKSMTALDTTLADARPGLKGLANETLPEVNALVRDLRAVSENLNAVAVKIDQQGATSLLGGPPLPDYKPGKGTK